MKDKSVDYLTPPKVC